jgi:hypothetical protein
MVKRGWTHIAPAALFAASLSAGPLHADASDDALGFFATCAGQLGEQLRHFWTISDPAADRTEAVLDATLAVLAALTTPENAVAVRARRVEARAAHGRLLSRAFYQGDAWAADRADRVIAHCAALVLGPGDTAAVAPDGPAESVVRASAAN